VPRNQSGDDQDNRQKTKWLHGAPVARRRAPGQRFQRSKVSPGAQKKRCGLASTLLPAHCPRLPALAKRPGHTCGRPCIRVIQRVRITWFPRPPIRHHPLTEENGLLPCNLKSHIIDVRGLKVRRTQAVLVALACEQDIHRIGAPYDGDIHLRHRCVSPIASQIDWDVVANQNVHFALAKASELFTKGGKIGAFQGSDVRHILAGAWARMHETRRRIIFAVPAWTRMIRSIFSFRLPRQPSGILCLPWILKINMPTTRRFRGETRWLKSPR